MKKSLVIWRYNAVSGVWDYMRSCSADTADYWLAIWQKDEPTRSFKLSRNRPKGRP